MAENSSTEIEEVHEMQLPSVSTYHNYNRERINREIDDLKTRAKTIKKLEVIEEEEDEKKEREAPQ